MPDRLPKLTDEIRRDPTAEAAYQRLFKYTLGELRRDLDKLSSARPSEATVARINEVADTLAKVVTDGEDVAQPQPVQGNRQIEAAIDHAGVVGSRVRARAPDTAAALQRMFGDRGDEVAPRFTEISQTLLEYFNRTDGRNVDRIFYHDPKLPENVPALAKDFPDGTKAIAVSTLVAEMKVGERELAASLVHEGSHTLPHGIVDFAYRNRWKAHYYLPPDAAVLNAANYEQVARDLLEGPGRTELTAAELTQIRTRPGSGLEPAMALLMCMVTRAWVIGAFDVPENYLTARADAAAALDIPTGFGELSNRLYEALGAHLQRLMRLVTYDLDVTAENVNEFRAAPTRQAARLAVAAPQTTVAAATPRDLAEEILMAVLRWGTETARWAFSPEQLARYILRIDEYDRTQLRPILRRYFLSFTS